MGTYLLVDSGTSHTRVRLWCDGRIAASAERAVGSHETVQLRDTTAWCWLHCEKSSPKQGAEPIPQQ